MPFPFLFILAPKALINTDNIFDRIYNEYIHNIILIMTICWLRTSWKEECFPGFHKLLILLYNIILNWLQ